MATRKKKPLDKKRSYIKGLITRAKKRIEELIKEGSYEASFAVQNAMRTKNAKYGDELFSIENMKSSRELDREKGRLLAFLSDRTSESKIAQYESQQMTANKAYGGKIFTAGLVAMYGKRYADDIDEEKFKMAARIYRQLTSYWTNITGKAGYGSNNLINFLYDEVSRTAESFSEDAEKNGGHYVFDKDDEEVEKIVNKNATQLLEAFNKNPYMFSSLRDALNYNPIKTRK